MVMLYQIKRMMKSATQSQILYLHAPSKHFFLKVVMLHIKFIGMEHIASCKHIFCPYTHPRPVGLGQNICSEYGYVAYQIKGKELFIKIEKKDLTLHTPLTRGQVERSDIKIVQVSIFLLD